VDQIQILLVSGSLRAASTNSALLRTAAAVAPPGVSATVYEGMDGLPHFNPDDDAEGIEVPAAVAALRAQLEAADAVLFSPPEYAGALPGSFKNLLEWTVGGDDGLVHDPALREQIATALSALADHARRRREDLCDACPRRRH
jgi:NAD(P)H-dependent FMN reductase